MRVNPREVAPSQDFLKEKTTRFILECLRNGDEASLPPTPIVRKDEKGGLIAIDGHNLLAARAYHNQLADVHMAESSEHGLPEDDEASILRNQDLREKFESSLVARDIARANGVNSFDDLIAKYPELFEDQK
jgi:hypothetical protein